METSNKHILATAVTLTANYVDSTSARVSAGDQLAFYVRWNPGESGNVLSVVVYTSDDDENVADASAVWTQHHEWTGSTTLTKNLIDYADTASGTDLVKLKIDLNTQAKRVKVAYKETPDGSPVHGTISVNLLSRSAA